MRRTTHFNRNQIANPWNGELSEMLLLYTHKFEVACFIATGSRSTGKESFPPLHIEEGNQNASFPWTRSLVTFDIS